MPRALAAPLYLVAIAAGCGGGDATPDATVVPCQATADPHDEDGDGIFDACDNCPAVANATQLDTTERAVRAFPDAVGDACDPRPGGSGDVLFAFETFAADPGGWDGWTIAGDAAQASGDATWTSARIASGDGLFVRAELATFAMRDPAGGFAITLDDAFARTCTLQADRLVASAGGDGGSATMMLDSPIASDEPVALVGWRVVTGATMRSGRLICRVVRGVSTTEVSLELGDDLVGGEQAIRALQADVALSSLSVYTSPGPKNP